MKQPAVFLDRDGTLLEEVNYLHRVEDMRTVPAAAEALTSLKQAGYLLIVVTNQSGIGRGIYSETDMHGIHDAMQRELSGLIDAFYFCPHLPCDGCSCRKPGLGMIESAMANFEIEIGDSWMIGDKKIDVETGKLANMQTALVLTGYGASHEALLQEPPDLVAEDIGRVVEAIIGLRHDENRPRA